MPAAMIPAPSPDFERRLIENIEPIRQFFLANALHHGLRLGIFAELAASPGLTTHELAARLELDAARLGALARFLQNETYLRDDDGWRLTAKGQELPEFAPWYQMLVGGYASTFEQISDVLRGTVPYASRDTAEVGAGSCALGVYDALPLAVYLLDSDDSDITTLVDVGCGDAGFLIEILNRRPGLKGIGVEPNPGSVERARRLREQHGLTGRLEIVQAGAAELPKLDLPDQGRGVAFMTAFVLQEFLEQDGEQAVRDLLAMTFDAHPDTRWIVVEMDYQPTAPVVGTHGLARAFYNPYFLIHNITQQRLETRQWWQDVFTGIGLSFTEATTDPHVDSTGLQIGFLLSRS
jgi:2-ketoarginine methyltransferase